MKIIDDFIAEIKEFGITKASKLSGVPYATIYSWVHKIFTPTLEKAQIVASVMGLEFLLFDKE